MRPPLRQSFASARTSSGRSSAAVRDGARHLAHAAPGRLRRRDGRLYRKSSATDAGQYAARSGDSTKGRQYRHASDRKCGGSGIPAYQKAEAIKRETKLGWRMLRIPGKAGGASYLHPHPQGIHELEAIRACLDPGFVVIAAGGGGMPWNSTLSSWRFRPA